MREHDNELLARLTQALGERDAMEKLPVLLEETQPYDLSEALHALPEAQALRVLAAVPAPLASESLEHLEFLDQYRLLHHLPADAARPILGEMSSDDLADLVLAIHPKQAEALLELMPEPAVGVIRSLAQYPENTAGGRMTVDYISVRQQMTAEQVLRHIRKVGDDADIVNYIYVVDAAGRLTGVITLRELIMATPRTPVAEFMNESVVSVPAAMDQEEVARVVSDYDFIAVPVVGPEERLLGVVTVDDVIDVIQEEATEDVLRLGATDVPADMETATFAQQVWRLARPRLPWLVGLLFLEMGSSVIVGWFAGVITPALAAMLAMFTVVMAGESGNAATQSLAVVVRGLATGEIEDTEMPRIVLREATVGVIVGLLTGTVLTVTAWFWQHNLRFSLAVGLALAANLCIAKILGGLFPVIIHRVGIDPAVASGPFITTLTDNSSVLIYYGVAAVILKGLG